MVYISHFTSEETEKHRQNNLPMVKQAESEAIELEFKVLIS